MKNILTILFIAIFTTVSFGQKSAENQDWFVADKTVECTGVGKQQCLVVRNVNSNDWQLFYGQIKGFKFRENYTQKIRVRISPQKNVPADASALNYKLVKVLSRSKTDGNTLEEAQNQMSNQKPANITAQKWTLTEINGKKIEGNKPTLQFDEKEKRFGIKICNGIGGNYRVNDSNIEFYDVISTMMACPEPIMGNEVKFNEAVEKVTRFEQKGDSLVFFAKDKPVLKFVSEMQSGLPNKTLENTKWVLTNIGTKPISPKAPFPYLEFDKETSRVSGLAACNRISGGYTISGDALKFGAIAMTRMACIDPEKGEIERQFTQALEKVNRFEVKNGTLSLFDGTTLLLKFMPLER